LRHALVQILAREHFRDPALDGVQVTVTEVRIGPDLRHATAFVVPFGGGEGRELVAALNRAAGFLRAQVAHAVKLRYAPSIRFEIDRTFENASRIDRLLHDARVVRDLAAPSGQAAGSEGAGDDGNGA
jgi:ribosome-binding factor A